MSSRSLPHHSALADMRSRAQDSLLLNHELGIARAGTTAVQHAVGAAKAFVGGDVVLVEADQSRCKPDAGYKFTPRCTPG